MSFLANIYRRLRWGPATPRTEFDADIRRCEQRIAECREALPYLRSADKRMWTKDALRKAEERLRDLRHRQAKAIRETEVRASIKRAGRQKAANPLDPYANDPV